MIIYSQRQQIVEKQTLSLEQEIPSNTIWIDIVNTSPEEELKLEQHLKINIPNQEEIKNVPVSNRLYEEQGAIFMTITLFLNQTDNNENLTAYNITFIICKNILITIRDTESNLFDNIIPLIKTKYLTSKNACYSLLLLLLKKIINNTSAFLENMGHCLNIQNDNIICSTPGSNMCNNINYKILLKDITNIGSTVALAHESLTTFNRMLTFISQLDSVSRRKEFISRIKIFLKDIEALREKANFLSTKINFLLDATLGLINIEQNNIIKIFSVVSVIFMPPTLIASIYGMNFDIIPELKWTSGYPIAIVMMLISSWLPYRFFKKKKWL